jgi:hypothetical protein
MSSNSPARIIERAGIVQDETDQVGEAGQNEPVRSERQAPPLPSTQGQKLLERLLALRNLAGHADLEMKEVLIAVRGPSQVEAEAEESQRSAEARTATTFLGGFDALMTDLERMVGSIADGAGELKRLF